MSSFRVWAVAMGCMMSLFIIDGVCADDLDLDVQAPVSQVAWSGDWLVRGDVVRSSLYGDHVTRLWTRVRYGPTWQIDDRWTLGGALRVDESTVGNDEVIDNNDNERSRDLALDSLFVSYAPTPTDRLLVGKTAFPFVLSRMLWDPDLRPAGISYMHEMQFGADDTFRITGGGFRGEQMFGDQSRIVALQFGLTLHQTSLVSPEFVLTELRFSDLDALAAAGLDRDNDAYSGHFADRFELIDAQFMLHINTALPMRLLVDVDRNVKAGSWNKAGRFEFAVGNSFRAQGQEAGIAVERIQRESVLGAFNDDDWWFHAAMRGTMLWWAYGVSDRVRFRAAFFHEQPDWNSYSYATRRLLLDLQWQL
ncbi:MAG: putative porin [Gammaproteobacteria bacterium]